MRAILINAKNQVVREIDIQPDGEDALLVAIYEAIGCKLVDLVRLGDHDLWVDDEGSINGTEVGFTLSDRPFVGNGLILSYKGEESAAATLPVETINEKVGFWSLNARG